MPVRLVEDRVALNVEDFGEPGVEANDGFDGVPQQRSLISVGGKCVAANRSAGERQRPNAGHGDVGRFGMSAGPFKVGTLDDLLVGPRISSAVAKHKPVVKGFEVETLPIVHDFAEGAWAAVHVDNHVL